MSVFKNKNSISAADPFISVNGDVKASISNRVDLHTQNIQFFKDDNSSEIAFIARSYETGFKDSKKGMFLIFSSDIQSGTYNPADPAFPFQSLYYYENGANDNFTTSYVYEAEVGIVKVEVISKNQEALRYLIDFDFKGKDNRTEELHIKGIAHLNVFTRSS
ncbi:hypothetical protein ACKJSM_00575 [Pseudomonas sp. PHC1]|uniref:hypothetical protein n=1 Tax=Pseudomonas sp. PHC1 TaxID=3384759 RepID=UPI00396F4B96